MISNQYLARFWLALERLGSGLRSRSITLGELVIPYLEGGSGPDLVLIHGFGADRYNFARVAKFLGQHFHVIIPDLPGFGDASKLPTTSYDMRSQADHVAAFMNSVGIKSAHIGGNSMGGSIAAHLAMRHPDRVRSLWLLNALGCPSAHNSAMHAEYQKTGKLPLIIRSVGDFERLMSLVVSRKMFMPNSVRNAFIQRAIRDANLHEVIAQELSDPQNTLTDASARIRIPTLIVWGEEDRILSPSCIPEQQAIFLDHRVVVMKGTGHLPMLENPKTVAHDYLEFITSKFSTQ